MTSAERQGSKTRTRDRSVFCIARGWSVKSRSGVSLLLVILFLVTFVFVPNAVRALAEEPDASQGDDLISRGPKDLPVFQPPGGVGTLLDLIAIPEEGRGIQVVAKSGSTVYLFEFDLETFEVLRQKVLTGVTSLDYRIMMGNRAIFSDFSRKRSWLIKGKGTCVGFEASCPISLKELNLDTLDFTSRAPAESPSQPWGPPGYQFKAARVSIPPGGGLSDLKLHFLWRRPTPTILGTVPGESVFVSQVGIDANGVATREWIVPIRVCNARPLDQGADIFRSSSEQAVYFNCAGSNWAPIMVRLTLDANGQPFSVNTTNLTNNPTQVFTPPAEESSSASPNAYWSSIADQVGNRMVIRVSSIDDSTAWVFDGATRKYVGVVFFPSGGSNGAPLFSDLLSGRLFQLVPDDALYLTDGRTTPVAQAERYPQVKIPGNPKIVNYHPATADLPGQIFIMPELNGKALFVYRDLRPPLDITVNINDTGKTDDVEEKPGATSATYSGSGRGYGLKVKLLSGAEAFVPEQDPFGEIPLGNGIGPQNNSVRSILRQVRATCSYTDRELTAGKVGPVELSTLVTGAKALALDADSATKSDLATPARSCWPQAFPPIPTGTANTIDSGVVQAAGTWNNNYPEAQCGTDKSGSSNVTGTTEVKTACDAQGKRASGIARIKFGPTQAPLTVREAGSTTTVRVDPQRGLVSTTISWAKGITVPGAFMLDEVWAKGESWAKGRPGQNGGAYTARACGFRDIRAGEESNAGFSETGTATDNPASQCRDPAEIALRMKAILGTRGNASGPQIDKELKQGSPRGYQASVQKDRLVQIASKALNRDDSAEVPALEIVIWDDSYETGRARQVYQLAGLASTSAYGITKLEEFVEEDTPPDDSGATTVYDEDPGDFTQPTSSQDLSLISADASDGEAPLPLVGTTLKKAIQKIFKGFQLALRTPSKALAVWAAIGLPVYLALRRKSLIRSLGLAS